MSYYNQPFFSGISYNFANEHILYHYMKTILNIFFATMLVTFFGCGKNNDTPDTVTDANFLVSGYEVAAPCPVTFINTSRNATSYRWNFGDGTTSTQSNPVHTYSLAGTYLLTLKATGANGVDSVCKLVSIEAAVPPNRSAFSYFFDRCTGTPVGAVFRTVNPLSTATVWDFGNGIINTTRDPIIQFFQPGDYTVKYSSQIGGVRDTVIRVIRIQ
jgi:PKD repeat protein